MSYSSLYPRRSTLLNERETGLAAGLAPTPRLSQTPSQRKLLTEHRPGLTQSGRAGHLVAPQFLHPGDISVLGLTTASLPVGLVKSVGVEGLSQAYSTPWTSFLPSLNAAVAHGGAL